MTTQQTNSIHSPNHSINNHSQAYLTGFQQGKTDLRLEDLYAQIPLGNEFFQFGRHHLSHTTKQHSKPYRQGYEAGIHQH